MVYIVIYKKVISAWYMVHHFYSFNLMIYNFANCNSTLQQYFFKAHLENKHHLWYNYLGNKNSQKRNLKNEAVRFL